MTICITLDRLPTIFATPRSSTSMYSIGAMVICCSRLTTFCPGRTTASRSTYSIVALASAQAPPDGGGQVGRQHHGHAAVAVGHLVQILPRGAARRRRDQDRGPGQLSQRRAAPPAEVV